MSCQVYFEDCLLSETHCADVTSLKNRVSQQYGISAIDLFVTVNGKSAPSDFDLRTSENVVRVFTKLVGGKGGFGSMLRAIGAQIEKTTNREACRDLSGRRLRDINEEKRLRKWLEGQEDREKEAVERKQKKIERLIAEPKINVKLNPLYKKERRDLPERVSAAVDAGWQAAGTSSEAGTKRKADDEKLVIKKKKLWIDAELSDCSSLSDDDDEDVEPSPKPAVSTDSGNESDHASQTGAWRTILLVCLLGLVAARPRPQEFDDEEEHHGQAGDKKDDVARVQIKVYRGPTKSDGYAPWGFWVKQPSDDD